MNNMDNSVLNEEFETWMCGVEPHKGPCPPEGCPKGKCAREMARLSSELPSQDRGTR